VSCSRHQFCGALDGMGRKPWHLGRACATIQPALGERNMPDNFGWISIASREAGDHALTMWLLHWVQTVVFSMLIWLAIHYRWGAEWAAVLAFVGVTLTLGSSIIVIGRRLDAGRSFLEQCCHHTQQSVENLQSSRS